MKDKLTLGGVSEAESAYERRPLFLSPAAPPPPPVFFISTTGFFSLSYSDFVYTFILLLLLLL